jgi:acid phosphatase (class A)
MRSQVLVVVLLALVACAPAPAASPQPEVVHPAPKDPVYIEPGWYETLRARFPPPPARGSERQARDESELLRAQKERTPADCAEARDEVSVSLRSFFGGPQGALDDAAVQRLAPFFEQLRNDGDFFVQKLKKEHPRQRPFAYVAGLEPCVAREVTDAYPSGHSVLARLFALVLADLYPDRRDALDARARRIARHRVMSGMHHPSDVEVGREIGELLHAKLAASPRFQADLAALR